MTQPMQDALKPCPFCGGEAGVVRGAPEIFVSCLNQYCNPGRNLIETAISDWNTRAQPTPEADLESKYLAGNAGFEATVRGLIDFAVRSDYDGKTMQKYLRGLLTLGKGEK